jgi:integrase/recombinase XerD
MKYKDNKPGDMTVYAKWFKPIIDIKIPINKLRHNHSFRHSYAVHMLLMGKTLTDIKNHLGHENLKSTMIYLYLSVSKKRDAQRKYIEHMKNSIDIDYNVSELLKSESKEEILKLLDSL